MPLKGSGYPQTVNIHVSVGINRNPCILSRNILNKALSSLHALEKNKSFIKSVCQPSLLRRNLHVLIIGNGTADVLLFQIILCNSDILHMFSLPLHRSNILICGYFSGSSVINRKQSSGLDRIPFALQIL